MWFRRLGGHEITLDTGKAPEAKEPPVPVLLAFHGPLSATIALASEGLCPANARAREAERSERGGGCGGR